MDEEEIEGQISAREPLQNREYMSKDMYDSKYGKQISLRKRTKTPIDKVIYLQRYEKLHIFWYMFSPRNSWKIAELALNNKYSLTLTYFWKIVEGYDK